MTNDAKALVERLRTAAVASNPTGLGELWNLCDAAADLIEELTAPLGDVGGELGEIEVAHTKLQEALDAKSDRAGMLWVAFEIAHRHRARLLTIARTALAQGAGERERALEWAAQEAASHIYKPSRGGDEDIISETAESIATAIRAAKTKKEG